jgi:ubiquinone biosynthesis monooxygenase Coq7
MMRFDEFISAFDRSLRVITGVSAAHRPYPAAKISEQALSEQERRHSAGLMRVNHVGEVCAQALYEAQARFARNPATEVQLRHAGEEELDHLAWTAIRLTELGSRPSLLNPLWYAGSFALGAIAARMGDAQSLGFVVETERQVEAHLNGHLSELPAADLRSRAIVVQMRDDEAAHGASAQAMGAADLPLPVRTAMRGVAKIMTGTAYYI